MKGRHVGVFWRSSEDARPDMVAACRHAVAPAAVGPRGLGRV